MTKDDGERLAESFRHYHDQIAAMNDEQRGSEIDALRTENERLKRDNELAANELVEYGKLLAQSGAENERLRALILDWHQAVTPGERMDAIQALNDEAARLGRSNCQ